MPDGDNGNIDPTQKLLDEWGVKSISYQEKLEAGSQRLNELQAKMQTLEPVPRKEDGTLADRLKTAVSSIGAIPLFPSREIVSKEIEVVVSDIAKSEFYSRLYTVVPIGILGDEITTVEEALSAVNLPATMSSEIGEVREIVQSMLSGVNQVRPEVDMQIEPGEEGGISLPSLVKPTIRELAPNSIQQLTVDSIIQYLTTPSAPPPVLEDAEWDELLAKTHPEYADMTQVEIVRAEAQRIIAESKLMNEQMAGFQSAIAEMPDYELADFLRESIMQPGLAMLEVATIYFEKVSMPIAASVYKTFIPDIEDAYQQYRIAGDTNWEALEKSWENWDAPGSGVPEFLLKYMFMETLTDPLTLLSVFTLGVSMASGITGRFGRFASILNKANRVVFAPFELPFTGIKALIAKLPKTISQRAAMVEGATGRVVKQYMEQFSKGKLLNKGMTIKDWDKLAKRAIDYTFNNPNATDVIAETGRVLLKHKPISREEFIEYGRRLGAVITPEDVSPQRLADINTIFEAMFQKYGARNGKLMLPAEAAKRMLEIFGLGGSNEKTWKIGIGILERRAEAIISSANSFAKATSPGRALQQLMRRNFDYHIAIERAISEMLISKSGRFNQLYAGIEAKFVAVWQKYIEEIFVRPIAQSYLTFAMYGPMNVIEDNWRSILGGVFPRRMTVDRMGQIGRGLSLDPDLVNPSLAVSETIGRMSRRGGDDQWNNWVIQLATLGQKDWADKLYTGLVRLPGGLGMDIRRNFVGQKYLTLYREMGGEAVETIMRTEARAPSLVDRKLVKEVKNAVNDAKTALDIDGIRSVKDIYTRKSIYRREVQSIMKEHPDLPNSVRDFIVDSFDDGTLFLGGERGPAKIVPKEVSELRHQPAIGKFPSITEGDSYRLTTTGGDSFEVVLTWDDVNKMWKAKRTDGKGYLSIDTLYSSERVRLKPKLPPKQVPGVQSINDVMKQANTRLMDDYLKGGEYATKQFQELTDMLIELEVKNPEEMAHLLYNLNIASDIYGKAPEEILAQATIASQGQGLAERRVRVDKVFDDILEFRDKAGGSLEKLVGKLRVDIARKPGVKRTISVVEAATLEDPNIPLVRLWEEEKPYIQNLMRDIKEHGIREPIQIKETPGGGQIVWEGHHRLVAAQQLGIKDIPVEFLDVAGKGIVSPEFGTEYVTKTNRLLDLMIAKKSLSDQFRLEDMAWRHELFAGVDAKQMTNEWWEGTYRQMRQRISEHKNKVVGIEGDILLASKEVDLAAGIKPFSRQPIRVVDRALAPQDVASLVGAQGDDLSRALLDNLTIVNDREMFIEFVIRQVRPGDEGFTREAIGEVFDQIARQARLKPGAISWVTSKQMELEAVRGDLHQLYNSKLLPDSEIKEIGRYVDETADMVDKLVYQERTVIGKVPDYDIGLGERVATPSEAKMSIHALGKPPEGAPVLVSDPNYLSRIRTELTEAARRVQKGDTDLAQATKHWFETSNNNSLQLMGEMASGSPEYLTKIRGILRQKYPSGYIRIYRGSGQAKGVALEREFTNVTSSRTTAKTFQDNPAIWDKAAKEVEKPAIDNILIHVNDVVAIGSVDESELIIRAGVITKYMAKPLKAPVKLGPKVIKPEYTKLQDIRQKAMDEAHTWYYKEFTDYTNGNAFDAIMKGAFPFWNYETQRWFWAPRSFVRNPGTFTALERWQDNTDYGYIPTPLNGVELNPFRGTIYGPFTTRLSRRDYPEYYDAWAGAEPVNEFFDWLSRYGFYLGGHMTIPMSLFGGLETQVGESLPPIWETPLMVLQAAAPESDAVKMLTDHIFSDRFRTYMTIQEVIHLGGDGVVISAKMKENKPLTEEEQAVWDEARRSAAKFSILFENTGLFRLRRQEKQAVYDAATAYIEEKYGYTEDQQKWMRMHGKRIWDQIGGMSLEDQRILEELEYFRYSGTIDRLLPGRQQLVLDKLTLAWNSVEKFVNTTIDRKMQLEKEFRAGALGPDDYQNELRNLYDEQGQFIYNEMRDSLDEPLPEGLSKVEEQAFVKEHSMMELEGRMRYYEKWGIPLPVLHPLKELLNLYYAIELKETIDPETGEKVKDWDTFWTQRQAIEEAVPDMWKGEFQTYMTKNETGLESIRRRVYQTYFNKYWWIYDQVLKGYNDDEQKLIKEYLSLEKRGVNLSRQAEIKATESEKTGNLIILGFRSEVSGARRALRYNNPTLDAWLFYWGRTASFETPEAEIIYHKIARDTGRSV